MNVTLESKRQTSAQFRLEQKNVKFSPIYISVNKLDIGPDYYIKNGRDHSDLHQRKKVDKIYMAYILIKKADIGPIRTSLKNFSLQ